MRISDWSSDVCSSDLCFLRQAPEAAGRGGLRWLCREDVQALLCAADGSPVAAAGPLFPHAADRLFRGHRQRTRDCLALFGFAVAAGVPATVEPRQEIGRAHV